jgi:hypothetical protein
MVDGSDGCDYVMIRVDVGRDGGIVFIEKKMVKENCLSLFM